MNASSFPLRPIHFQRVRIFSRTIFPSSPPFVIYRFAFTRSREAKFALCGVASTVPEWKCTHIFVAVNEIKVVKTINAEIARFFVRIFAHRNRGMGEKTK